MRIAVVASAVVVLIGGSATYALVGRPAAKVVEAKAPVVEAPRVETARLFAPAHDVSPAPASDLIAIKLAAEPVTWPAVPKPAVRQQTAAKPAVAEKPASTKKPVEAKKVEAKKPVQAKKKAATTPANKPQQTKKPQQAKKPTPKKEPAIVTGSL